MVVTISTIHYMRIKKTQFIIYIGKKKSHQYWGSFRIVFMTTCMKNDHSKL